MTVYPHHTDKELLTFYKTEMDSRLARRIQAVRLARQGRTCPEIMEITGGKRRAVQNWIRWYNESGIEGLKDDPRSGRRVKLSPRQIQELRKRLDSTARSSDGEILNGPTIRDMLEKEFGVIYCLSSIYIMLERLGYSCLCPRPVHENADPAAQEAFKKTSVRHWKR